MPMQWNDQADARLFSNVLRIHVVKLDYHALAKAMGNGVTPKAISHRISKIKEKAKLYLRDHPYAFAPDYEEPRPVYAGGPAGKPGSRKNARAARIAASKAKDMCLGGSADDEEPGCKMEFVKSEPCGAPHYRRVMSFVHGEADMAVSEEQKPEWLAQQQLLHGFEESLPPLGNFYDFTRDESVAPGLSPMDRVQEMMADTQPYGSAHEDAAASMDIMAMKQEPEPDIPESGSFVEARNDPEPEHEPQNEPETQHEVQHELEIPSGQKLDQMQEPELTEVHELELPSQDGQQDQADYEA
ncbi:hypothetical protein EDC01DRAFT_779675 [Geopyxis carbonaria]|nr:hypothetical protein EDC01DRAFT_779675 [Geopyxis carbonaria]